MVTKFKQSQSKNKLQTLSFAVRMGKLLVLLTDITTMKTQEKEINEILRSKLWNDHSHIINVKNYSR